MCEGVEKAWKVLRRVQRHEIRQIQRWVHNDFRAAFFLDGRTDLQVIDRGALTSVRYRYEVLQPIVRPFACAVGPAFILM